MKRNATAAIVIHTTASNTWTSAEAIQNFFLRILRWGKGGYHHIYEQNGTKKVCYDWRTEATYGILPSVEKDLTNLNTIHLSYIGGIRNTKQNELVCNIMPAQEEAILKDVKNILKWYPHAKIIGHNQINQKGCPSFFVPDWLRAWNVDESLIDTRDPFNAQNWIKQNVPHPIDFYKNRRKKIA